MRFDHLQYHLNRRQMLAGMAKVGAAGVAASAGGLPPRRYGGRGDGRLHRWGRHQPGRF